MVKSHGRVALRTLIALAMFLSVPICAIAQYVSTSDRIERVIAQNEPNWILLNKWVHTNARDRQTTYVWQLDKKDIRDQKQILLWMLELQSSEEAAREFYNISPPPTGQTIPQLPIGEKCYLSNTIGLLIKKGNFVVRLGMSDSMSAVRGSIVDIDVLIRFAKEIAYVIPSQPMTTRNRTDEKKEEEAPLHLKRGAAKLKEDHFEEALEEFKKAIELDPESADAHHALGLGYLKTGARVKALDALREATRLKPDWPEAQYNLGRAYYDFGDYKSAAISFEEAIRLKRDFFDALIELGATYQHSGLNTKSVEVLRNAVLLRPDHIDTRIALGTALLLSAQPREAMEILEEVVRLSPANALAYSMLGESYRLLGKI
jgi:tetratricopeptide (TPR) repeat protein